MRTFQHTVAARAGGDADRVADRQRATPVISRIGVYKTESAELSTPAKTRAEDSATFTDDKIAFFLSEVNRAMFAGGATPADARTGRGHSEDAKE